MAEIERSIELKATRVMLRSDGLLHIHIRSGADMQLDDAVATLSAMRKLGKGKKFPVLIDAGEFAAVDKEVRILSASREGNLYTLADAIVHQSFAQQLIANFYVKHNKPVVPTRIFRDHRSAVRWLKTFLKKPASKKDDR